jgi:hypothetical protein
MSATGRGEGLRTIFSFFLGLMVATFAGVGVYTFHPPDKQYEMQMRDLDRQEQDVTAAKPVDQLTDQEQAQLREFRHRREELSDAHDETFRRWGRSTSIMLVILATLAMAISLIRSEQLPVISNGLLLGGVFTMLYGVGWIVATDTTTVRFVVMTVALAVTLGLGYVRFVRRRAAPAAAAPGPVSADVAEIDRRLRSLEDRLADAARAFDPRRDG